MYYYVTIALLCVAMATAENDDFLGSLDISTINRNSNPTPQDVQIQCHSSRMCVSLSKEWLHAQWGVSSAKQLSLRERCDSFAEENDTDIVLCTNDTKMTSCGSRLSQNDTHVTFSNTVLILLLANDASVSFAPSVKASLPWKCTYPIHLLVGVKYVPKISPVTVFLGNKTGYGKFEAAMFLYKDEKFKNVYDATPSLDITDRLRVKVQLLQGPGQSRVQVVKCWGTPVPFPEEKLSYTLIEDYCPSATAKGAEVKLRNNGDLQHALWESNVFRFVVTPEVYLHCHIRVCFDGQDCEKKCAIDFEAEVSKRRKRREIGPNTNSGILTLGPLVVGKNVPVVTQGHRGVEPTIPVEDTTDESPKNVRNGLILGMPKFAVFAMIGGLGAISLALIIGVFVALQRRAMRERAEKAQEWKQKIERRPQLAGRFTLSNSPPFEIPISVPNSIVDYDCPNKR